jgi:putative transposase
MIPDAHPGLKAAVRKVFEGGMAALQGALLSQRSRTCAQAQPGRNERGDEGRVRSTGRKKRQSKAADLVRQFQARFAKAMEIFEAGIDDVLSYLHYPQPLRTRISSTNPFKRLNLEIRRRTRVVGIFPHAAACLRLIGMLLVEKNEDWLTDDKAYLTFDDVPVEESATKVVLMAAA